MEEQNKVESSGVLPSLEAKLFSLCETHASKYTSSCLDCTGEGCLESKEHHPSHQTLHMNGERIRINQTPHSYRRKSRKGIPSRSPLF
ncbi:hypothetical protein ES319_D11G205700v1 [Gossypium barbadense]|uniref:Uncharacterized protein n=2 Tax=Gossypium TaxID=3633 RepID=A0A5J5PDL0_GOSBA|nr:hypothetical protein ES319_D11G205700v1 [Gossypium barbadense]PPD71988.1 hypothetical protein GOBAR_DD31116 [Gossypium barbadense]TYG45955.1 hypothetical protein ES288_D11G217200v1 [Gossypium darwinii]